LKIRVLLAYFILVISFVSCKAITKKSINFSSQFTTPSLFEKGDKSLVFIPMIHLNTPEFYSKTKILIDSLRAEDYVVFYEGVKVGTEDSLEIDRYERKFRKLTHVVLRNYYDEDAVIYDRYKIKGMVYQTDVDFGPNPDIDCNVDLTIKALIDTYESEYGAILLDECDMQIPLGSKYKCSKKNTTAYTYLISSLRDEHLYEEIKNSSHKKLIVVYGKAHFYPLNNKLKSDGWEWIRVEDFVYMHFKKPPKTK